MAWIRGMEVKEMLRYGIEYYACVFENDCVPSICAYSPAFASIFGEHTDYNRGYAMAVTLPLITMVLLGANQRNEINIATDLACGGKLQVSYELDTFQTDIKDAPTWAKITLWAISVFKEKINEGLNIAYVSCIPPDLGLGSSTAMTTAIFTALECLNPDYYSHRQKIKMCLDIEVHGSETYTGFAHPMTILSAEVGYALAMDCKCLSGVYLPIENLPVVFVITTSGVDTTTVKSKLKKRMKECEEVANLLELKYLGDITSTILKSQDSKLKKSLYNRAKHVLSETIRVHNATLALKKKDYRTLGLLMIQSHASLRKCFDMRFKEVESLISIAMGCPGVYGTKICGTGIGGNTITLVERKHVNRFVELMQANYEGECSFLMVQPWGCTAEISFEMKQMLYQVYPSLNKFKCKDSEEISGLGSFDITDSCPNQA